MNKSLTLRDGLGGKIPNLEALGVKNKPVQKLAEECDRLGTDARATGREWQAQQERVKALEDAHARARVLVYRGGPEPDSEQLRAARNDMDALDQKAHDQREAAILAREDLRRAVEAAPTIAKTLSARARPLEEEAAALERQAAMKRHEATIMRAAAEWAENPGDGFGAPRAPSFPSVAEVAV